ncbi:MAG: hypothetical protein V1783_09325 [Bacteroidota bacterium]
MNKDTEYRIQKEEDEIWKSNQTIEYECLVGFWKLRIRNLNLQEL